MYIVMKFINKRHVVTMYTVQYVIYSVCVYRFCRGCTIPCDSKPIGIDDPHYLAVEWNDAFLHLKYQSALERVSGRENLCTYT